MDQTRSNWSEGSGRWPASRPPRAGPGWAAASCCSPRCGAWRWPGSGLHGPAGAAGDSDGASFRRLFARLTEISPAQYWKPLRIQGW